MEIYWSLTWALFDKVLYGELSNNMEEHSLVIPLNNLYYRIISTLYHLSLGFNKCQIKLLCMIYEPFWALVKFFFIIWSVLLLATLVLMVKEIIIIAVFSLFTFKVFRFLRVGSAFFMNALYYCLPIYY